MEAEAGLWDTFNGPDGLAQIRSGVMSKRYALYTIEMTPGKQSWLVIQILPGCLWMWCYQGEKITEMTRLFLEVAFRNNLAEMGFFTRHKTVLRFLRKFDPVGNPTDIPGEMCWRMKSGIYPK